MKFNTVLFVAGAILLIIPDYLCQIDVCGRAPLNTERGVAERKNATAGAWPWQVSIQTNVYNGHFCSGSLIAKEWVLSVALCFQNVSASDILIYFGRLTQNGSNPHETFRGVKQIITYPDTNSSGYNVIALLQLNSSVTFSDYIRPVCLAAANSTFAAGTEGWVTGWDGLERFRVDDILQEMPTQIVDNDNCSKTLSFNITYNLMCAGRLIEGEKDQCMKDSGCPLVIKQGSQWIQSGILTYDRSCYGHFSSLYIRVSEYQDWINSRISTNQPGFALFPLISLLFSRGSLNLFSSSLALILPIIPLILCLFS